jgi:hypothetical protein
MMARRKLSGLDCSKLLYLRDSYIVTEESKIEMRDQGGAKTNGKIRGGFNGRSRTSMTRLLLAK